MDIQEAMKLRHSVRSYENRPLEDEIIMKLEKIIEECNDAGGLSIQLVKNEPKAFGANKTDYGVFRGVSNYIAMIGRKGPDLSELCGYYGEKLVLEAQVMGLNTCWVGLNYKKVPGEG